MTGHVVCEEEDLWLQERPHREADVSTLEQLEKQFEEKVECRVPGCHESAIWMRHWACCGRDAYNCGIHKYGYDTATGMPIFPRDVETRTHLICNTNRSWVKILTEDTWTHL